jgi:uncharacterized membrane protein
MSPDTIAAAPVASPPETPIFSARLTQSRSLDRRGVATVLLVIAALCAASGLIFAWVGAWPVAGFLGLDVLLVWFAFRANARAADAFEDVTITHGEMVVRRVGADGAVREVRLNPLWTKLTREDHAEFGLQRLFLVSRGRRFGVGEFLAPADKASFHDALARALADARRGPVQST